MTIIWQSTTLQYNSQSYIIIISIIIITTTTAANNNFWQCHLRLPLLTMTMTKNWCCLNTMSLLLANRHIQRTIPEQLIAEKMNDNMYTPTSHLLPDLHDMFVCRRLWFILWIMSDGSWCNSQRGGEKMVDLKGKLLKIIAAWNLGGNGDSNCW